MLPDWKALATLDDERLSRHDIAARNLACAAGMPGGPTVAQAAECHDRLDHYARAVADYTAKRAPDFQARPDDYDRSEGKGHLLFRWDGQGERFNVEATSDRIDAPPDDHYRRGRFQTDFDEEVYHRFLVSKTPREELACFLAQRGYIFADAGDYKRALEAFAWCCRVAGQNRSYERQVVGYLEEWRQRIEALMPPNFPAMRVHWPPRRHPWLPELVERRMVACELAEQLLAAPQHQEWWEDLRRSPHDRPRHVPVGVELRVLA